MTKKKRRKSYGLDGFAICGLRRLKLSRRQILFSGSLEEFKRGFPTRTPIFLKVKNIKMAAEVLEEKEYSPKI